MTFTALPAERTVLYSQIGLRLLDEFQQKAIPEIWVNPGAEDDAVMADARRRKMNVFFACSIVGIGRNPSDF